MHKQPNSDMCFVCGRNNPAGLYLTFYDNGEDEVVGRVAIIGDHHHFMVSVKLQVLYRHPVPTETPLKIRGRIVRLRGRLGKAQGEVILPDGRVACEAAITLADVPAEILSVASFAELGWHVDS